MEELVFGICMVMVYTVNVSSRVLTGFDLYLMLFLVK